MREDHAVEKQVPTPADIAKARQSPSRPGTTPSAGEAQPPPPARSRVVIAEDEALIRLDLKETLDELGYEVVGEAGDGEHAVALARELRPDLVILDVKMPVLDGISAAQRIAAAGIAPVVILTAFSQRDLVERARDAGAMAYLVKPFSSTDLMPAIEMAISRYAETAALGAEVSNLTEQLATRKVLDRAKGILQATRQLSEPEAFRWIQQSAMDQRVSMRAVADAVIASATPSAIAASTPSAARDTASRDVDGAPPPIRS